MTDASNRWQFGLFGFLAVTIVIGLVVGLGVRWAQTDLQSLLTFLVLTYSAGNFLFFFVVIGKMFENDMAAMAWACIIFTCMLWGPLLVFAVGWFYSGSWECKNWMVAWTVWLVVGLITVFSRAVF